MDSLRKLMDDSRPRQWVTIKQPVEPIPWHVLVPGAAIKPLVPGTFDLLIEPVQTPHVERNPIKPVMPMQFPVQAPPLFLYGVVAMLPAPLIHPAHCQFQLLLCGLSLHYPILLP